MTICDAARTIRDGSEDDLPCGVNPPCATALSCATAPMDDMLTCRIVKSAFSHDIAEGSSRVLLHLWVLAIEQTDKRGYSAILD